MDDRHPDDPESPDRISGVSGLHGKKFTEPAFLVMILLFWNPVVSAVPDNADYPVAGYPAYRHIYSYGILKLVRF